MSRRLSWIVFGLLLACAPAVATRLVDAPVVFKSGNWSVLRTIDSMTDEIVCTGIYKNNYGIQLGKEMLHIRVPGGPVTYQFRLDNEEAMDQEQTSDLQQRIGTIDVVRGDFKDLQAARRLRYTSVTLLGHVVEGDLDLTGLPEALHHIKAGCPGPPISNAPAEAPSTSE